MPRVTLDTTEAQSFELAEPGPYPMTVETIELETSGKNQAMFNVAFKFDDPATAQKCGLVYRRFMLEGKGSGFTREFWKAATGEDIPIGGRFDVDTDDAIGRPVIVKIGPREYEGRTYNEAETITSAA